MQPVILRNEQGREIRMMRWGFQLPGRDYAAYLESSGRLEFIRSALSLTKNAGQRD